MLNGLDIENKVDLFARVDKYKYKYKYNWIFLDIFACFVGVCIKGVHTKIHMRCDVQQHYIKSFYPGRLHTSVGRGRGRWCSPANNKFKFNGH